MRKYCDILAFNFFGVRLEIGNIDLRPDHTFSCYFIVEHPHDAEFIEKQARQLLLAGCKNFVFYGKYEPQWHNSFDFEDVRLHINCEDYDVALTSGSFDLEDFAEEIRFDIRCRPIVPHDTYLIYDDYEVYQDVLQLIGK